MVGGHFSYAAFQQMKHFGRVAVCGRISVYNDATPQTEPFPHLAIIGKELKVEGLMHNRWKDRHPESQMRLMGWYREGKLQCREHVTKGFENMPEAFMGMLKGDNTGKAIVAV